MTYTVFDTDGTVIARHLSAEAAAIAVLTHGHGAFEIRPDGKDFALWMTPQPGSGSITELARSQIASAETDATAARKEIFSQVITASGGWHGPTVIDDATYDLQLAGFENE